MTPSTFIFIGRSGCGKGTQVDLLMKRLEALDSRPICHLESGERFRTFINGQSHSSALSRAIYQQGGLQPIFLSVWIWSSLMVDNLTGDEHLVLDGMPRHVEEVKVLDSAFDFYGREKPFVVFIDISRGEAERRLAARGRVDDREASDVARRLDWFDTHVMPAIQEYESRADYRFIKVDGERSPEAIHDDILAQAGIPKE
jgi:adenylate kinase family enzyme